MNSFSDKNVNFSFAVDFSTSSHDISVDDEISNFLDSKKSKNTTYNTNTGCHRLQIFMKELCPSDNHNFYDLNSEELDEFFIRAIKVNKKSVENGAILYQPDT